MKRIGGIVGNIHADDELEALRDEHEADETLERVIIDADNRRRSRFRATTDAGTDVGVIVDKAAISVGDVLFVQDERMIVVAFEPRDALAVTLPEVTNAALEAAVELGHRIGNQHWDMAVEDGTVYVPLEADRHIVERVIADVVTDSDIYETTVEADLFVTQLEEDESVNEHEHGHGYTHGGEHEHDHSHGHDHKAEHSHGDRCHDNDESSAAHHNSIHDHDH